MNYLMKKYFLLLLFAFFCITPQNSLAAAPTAPSHFYGVSSDSRVFLFWDHSGDYGTPNLLGYKLYMSADNGASFDNGIGIIAPEGGILNNFYIVNSVSNGQNYIFKLASYNASLQESSSIMAGPIVPANNSSTDLLPPEDVSQMVINEGNEEVEIIFRGSTNLNGDLIGYKIFKSIDDGATYDDGVYIGQNTNYTYSNLSNNIEYLFKIVSVDGAGNTSTGITEYGTPSEFAGSISTNIQLGTQPFSTPTFKDVVQHPFRSSIEYLAARKIISGYSDGNFRPDININRGEAVTLLFKASGLQLDRDTVIETFSDVDDSNGLALYIQNAYDYSLIDGYSDGKFRPNDRITRAEFAKILVEVFSQKFRKVPENFATFKDVPVDNAFAPWIYAALKDKLVQGYEDSTFKPNQAITRGQAATMLARYFQKSNASNFESSIDELQALSLINAARIKNNLEPYRINAYISEISRSHAKEIANTFNGELTYFSADGKSPSERLDAGGVYHLYVSENIASTSIDGVSVTDALTRIHEEILKQPDNVQNQKANILSTYKNFTQVGIGNYIDTQKKKIYTVVDFVETDE